MLLAYLDESASADRHFIAAVIVRDVNAAPLAAQLDAIVGAAASAFGVRTTAELHGYDLMHGEADWMGMKPLVRARIGIYDKAMAVIATHAECIVVRGVYKPGVIAKYIHPLPPHTIVLQHVMERVNDVAAKNDEPVLLIADEVSRAAEHRRELWTYQRDGTPGWRTSRLPQIIDTIHFAPSHASRLVQAADLIAFMYRRRHGHRETDERAKKANIALWDRVDPICTNTSGCWFP